MIKFHPFMFLCTHDKSYYTHILYDIKQKKTGKRIYYLVFKQQNQSTKAAIQFKICLRSFLFSYKL